MGLGLQPWQERLTFVLYISQAQGNPGKLHAEGGGSKDSRAEGGARNLWPFRN